MLPGDLLRTIRARCREPESLHVYMDDTGDESNAHRATLMWRDSEVCALPVGQVPATNVYEYECIKCRTRARHPYVCRLGDPPAGFERRGAEFLREPTRQGHDVIRRLVRRGAREILSLCAEWRHPDTGVRLFRG